MQVVTTDTWLGFILRQVMSTTYTVMPNDCESWPWQIGLFLRSRMFVVLQHEAPSQSRAANHEDRWSISQSKLLEHTVCSVCWRFLVYVKSQKKKSLNHSTDVIMNSLDLAPIGSRWCDHDATLRDFQNGGWKGWGGGGTAVADATTKPTRRLWTWSITDLADVGC